MIQIMDKTASKEKAVGEIIEKYKINLMIYIVLVMTIMISKCLNIVKTL